MALRELEVHQMRLRVFLDLVDLHVELEDRLGELLLLLLGVVAVFLGEAAVNSAVIVYAFDEILGICISIVLLLLSNSICRLDKTPMIFSISSSGW